MLACEHGGINEVLVELYADTKNQKYLDLSKVFHHIAVLDSLALGFDILPGIHGNTQIPKLTGLARRHELTGDLNDKKAAEWFKKLEEKDKKALLLWKNFKELSMTEFEEIYKTFGIKFDAWLGESMYNKKMKEVISRINSSENQ